MKSKIIFLLAVFHCVAVGLSGALSVSEIIEKTRAKYGSLSSYSAEGTTVSLIDMTSMNPPKPPENSQNREDPFGFKEALRNHKRLEHSFRLKLSRPNLYRIEWEQEVHPAFTNKGAVWSAGEGDFLMVTENRYSKMASRELALGAATGVSGGAAHTIPALFFGMNNNLLTALADLKLEKEEAIDGTDCYVLSGGLANQRFLLWIGEGDFLIRRKRQLLGGAATLPDPDDDTIKETLKQLNKEVTPEAIAEMKRTMRAAREMSAKVKGSITETYRDVVVNPSIPKENFRYEVPEGLEPSPSPF